MENSFGAKLRAKRASHPRSLWRGNDMSPVPDVTPEIEEFARQLSLTRRSDRAGRYRARAELYARGWVPVGEGRRRFKAAVRLIWDPVGATSCFNSIVANGREHDLISKREAKRLSEIRKQFMPGAAPTVPQIIAQLTKQARESWKVNDHDYYKALIELAARGWILTYGKKGFRRDARPIRDPEGAEQNYENSMQLCVKKGILSATERLALKKIKMDTRQSETSALSQVPK
jgi:hypothetical protein